MLVSADQGFWAGLGLSRQSTMLLLNTEGASDPASYHRIVEEAVL
jgi:diaminopropionate ammonia-lyase